MSKKIKLFCLFLLIVLLFCAACEKQPDTGEIKAEETDTEKQEKTEGTGDLKENEEGADGEKEQEKNEKRILVSDGTNEIIFQLNDSSAAESLYQMLPLTTEVENYSNNEKIFYPSEKLDVSNVSEGSGGIGILAYFSPWGDVVMYYDAFDAYSGLYLLGEAVSGAEKIQNLTGNITITAVK